MKRTLARALIKMAQRIDANSVLDVWPKVDGPVVYIDAHTATPEMMERLTSLYEVARQSIGTVDGIPIEICDDAPHHLDGILLPSSAIRPDSQ